MSKTTSSEYSYSVKNNECIVLVGFDLKNLILCATDHVFGASILTHYYTLKQCCAKPGILQPCSVFKACWLSLALANACFLVV